MVEREQRDGAMGCGRGEAIKVDLFDIPGKRVEEQKIYVARGGKAHDGKTMKS